MRRLTKGQRKNLVIDVYKKLIIKYQEIGKDPQSLIERLRKISMNIEFL